MKTFKFLSDIKSSVQGRYAELRASNTWLCPYCGNMSGKGDDSVVCEAPELVEPENDGVGRIEAVAQCQKCGMSWTEKFVFEMIVETNDICFICEKDLHKWETVVRARKKNAERGKFGQCGIAHENCVRIARMSRSRLCELLQQAGATYDPTWSRYFLREALLDQQHKLPADRFL